MNTPEAVSVYDGVGNPLAGIHVDGAQPATVYVVMVCDHHLDPEPYPFSDVHAAIRYARKVIREIADPEESYEEPAVPEGWLFYATTGYEGDCVWVVARTLDGGSE